MWGLLLAAKLYGAILTADVVSVYDGDTIRARVHIWLGQEVSVLIRVKGVDTPEIRGKCPKEKELAQQARDFTREFVGDFVMIIDPENDKYGGRALAYVMNKDGQSLGQALIDQGLAREYLGGTRQGWCGENDE